MFVGGYQYLYPRLAPLWAIVGEDLEVFKWACIA